MALRNQPYIPLYIQDIMTDEKLNECSASTHGIYIKGIMCLMHKSEEYGKILLKQKYKQTDNKSKNFAFQLVKHLPYSEIEIENAINELIKENVCYFEGDYICQKRMIKDNYISIVRSEAGKKGGSFAQAKSEAKEEANTEDEYVNNSYNNIDKSIKAYKYNEFYDKELIESNNDKNYVRYIEILFGDNLLIRPLNRVLSMKEQISWKQFPGLIKIKNDCNVLVKDILIEMEQWDKLKKNTTVLGTFRTFAKRKIIKK